MEHIPIDKITHMKTIRLNTIIHEDPNELDLHLAGGWLVYGEPFIDMDGWYVQAVVIVED